MTVKAILAAKGGNVITIEPTASLEAAAKILAERRIGALVVTGPEQRVVGIVSERDIVAMLAARGCHALDVPLTAVMTRKVTTCSPSDTISSIMERMTAGKFRHVPVVEQGRLAGIISIGDVVKHRLQEMEHEQNALRDYIQTALISYSAPAAAPARRPLRRRDRACAAWCARRSRSLPGRGGNRTSRYDRCAG